jgi:hypothetical protein
VSTYHIYTTVLCHFFMQTLCHMMTFYICQWCWYGVSVISPRNGKGLMTTCIYILPKTDEWLLLDLYTFNGFSPHICCTKDYWIHFPCKSCYITTPAEARPLTYWTCWKTKRTIKSEMVFGWVFFFQSIVCM